MGISRILLYCMVDRIRHISSTLAQHQDTFPMLWSKPNSCHWRNHYSYFSCIAVIFTLFVLDFSIVTDGFFLVSFNRSDILYEAWQKAVTKVRNYRVNWEHFPFFSSSVETTNLRWDFDRVRPVERFVSNNEA